MNPPVTYEQVLRETAKKISGKFASKEQALYGARRLLPHVLSLDPVKFAANFKETFPENRRAALDKAVNRLLADEPVTRVIGQTTFYGYDFIVSPDVLDPRSDMEILIDAAKEIFPNRAAPLKILDVGTGSGCLSVTFAKEFPNSYVTGVDISEKALITAVKNAKLNNIEDRCAFFSGELSDLNEENFDLIVSNPPYISAAGLTFLESSVRNYDPLLALDGGEDGLRFYERFFTDFSKKLMPNGTVIVEAGIGQARCIKDIACRAGFGDFAFFQDGAEFMRAVACKNITS